MEGKIGVELELDRIPLIKLEYLVRVRRDCWAFCLACGHAERLQTRKIVIKAGWVAIETAQMFLRCIRCKTRGEAMLIPQSKPWPER